MPASAQAERPITRHLRRIKRGVDEIMDTGRDMCRCRDVSDPDCDTCGFCRAWLDMAESVNEVMERYESRIGDCHADA